MFTFTFVVACTECYQAVCYELMHYKVRLLELDPTKWFFPRNATQSAVTRYVVTVVCLSVCSVCGL